MSVLAIDQGTSSTKAPVIDPAGRVLGEGQTPVSPCASADGTVLQDRLELERSVVVAGRAALAAAGEAVSAIGLGNQGETVLRWDRESGEPLGPAISWQDRRAVAITRELAEHAERLEQLTGLPLDPYFAAPKMTLLAREGASGGVITTIDAWLTHRLTGAFVTDRATASRTMLMDLAAGEWSAEACAIFGLELAALPAIVANAQIVGETDAFGSLLPVSGLIVDQQAALFAQSCFAPGEAKCTYGTGAFILANAGYPAPNATALGVGALARLGNDHKLTPAGAVASWTPSAVFEPSISADQAAEHLAHFEAAAEALIGLGERAR